MCLVFNISQNEKNWRTVRPVPPVQLAVRFALDPEGSSVFFSPVNLKKMPVNILKKVPVNISQLPVNILKKVPVNISLLPVNIEKNCPLTLNKFPVNLSSVRQKIGLGVLVYLE